MKTEENYTGRSSMIFTLTKYYLGDQIKEDEMGRACDMYGEQEKWVQANSYIKEVHTVFWSENLMVRNHINHNIKKTAVYWLPSPELPNTWETTCKK